LAARAAGALTGTGLEAEEVERPAANPRITATPIVALKSNERFVIRKPQGEASREKPTPTDRSRPDKPCCATGVHETIFSLRKKSLVGIVSGLF
jgi:hypothetical protein